MSDTYLQYKDYLKSPTWRHLKNQVIIKSKNKCQLCESRSNLVVHHTKYPKILGTETLDDLQCLCETCHNVKCHGGIPSNSKIRLTKYEKRRRKASRKKARFAGSVKIYSADEIQQYAALNGT